MEVFHFERECTPWSLTLRKEHEFRMFENRVLRRIFGGSGGRLEKTA
jgi:hypothetical protein